MKTLPAGPAARPERYASALVHDEAHVRVVAFHLEPGQQVPPHRSDSSVLVIVSEGAGRFTGADGSAWLRTGESAVYAPGEMHSIEAVEESLRFMAVIAPRPGG